MLFDQIITSGCDASGQVFLTKHIGKLVLGHQFVIGGLELTDLDIESDNGMINLVAFILVELRIETSSLIFKYTYLSIKLKNGPLEFCLVDTFSLTFGF